jgi:hypothetical protein
MNKEKKNRIHVSGDAANKLLCALMSDRGLKEARLTSEGPFLDAVNAEISRRDEKNSKFPS